MNEIVSIITGIGGILLSFFGGIAIGYVAYFVIEGINKLMRKGGK